MTEPNDESRGCANCHFFKFEDASGQAWCDFLRIDTRCDVDACEFHRWEGTSQ